jgi:ubiquitin-conjugating enzyme E2 W
MSPGRERGVYYLSIPIYSGYCLHIQTVCEHQKRLVLLLLKMNNLFDRRLNRELRDMQREPSQTIILAETPTDITQWTMYVRGAEGTLYSGEIFTLQFKFPKKYPMESPEVMFVGDRIPVHPHVYSNGHICLSILYDQWSPALTVSAVCLSIISMLSSCTRKVSFLVYCVYHVMQD